MTRLTDCSGAKGTHAAGSVIPFRCQTEPTDSPGGRVYVAAGRRQPWTTDGVLPTFVSVSGNSASDVMISLAAFVVFYSVLLVAGLYMVVRTIRHGPDA